jgi:hypothetical protein
MEHSKPQELPVRKLVDRDPVLQRMSALHDVIARRAFEFLTLMDADWEHRLIIG